MSTGDNVTVAQLVSWITEQEAEALAMAREGASSALALETGTPAHQEAIERSKVGFTVGRQCSDALHLIRAYLGVVQHEKETA